jgi:hypothetical protein
VTRALGSLLVTLLVGYASPEYAILASDRMTTWTVPETVGGRTVYQKKYAEQITKTTFFGGQYLISYSGVADIGGNTEYWLVDRLTELVKPPNRSQWSDRLVAELVGGLQRLGRPIPSLWFSLLIAGYYLDRETGELRHMLRVISNAATQNYGDGRVGNYFWNEAFSFDTRSADFSLWAVGDPPPKSDMDNITDMIRRYRKHAPDRALEIARTMARVIVARSMQTPGVGDTVQVAILPRVAAGRQYMTVSLGPMVEPLTEVTSFEFNSKERDGFIISNDINAVFEGMSTRGGVVGPGEAYPIGPPPPFKPPA